MHLRLLVLLFFSTSFILNAQTNICILKIKTSEDSYFYDYDRLATICKGNKVRLIAEMIPNGKYQWKKNNVNILNATQSTVEVEESGNYTVEAVSPGCTYKSSIFQLDYSVAMPDYSIYKDGEQLFPNSSRQMCSFGATLDIYISNSITNGVTDIVWQRNGVDFKEGGSIYTTKEGVYTARAKNGNCQVSTWPITLTVTNEKISKPLASSLGWLDMPDTLKLCQGTSFEVGPNVDGYRVSDVQWFKDGKSYSTNMGASGRISVSEPGVYYATYINTNSCEYISKPLTVKVGNEIVAPTFTARNEPFNCDFDNVYFDFDPLAYFVITSATSKSVTLYRDNEVFKSYNGKDITFPQLQKSTDRRGIYRAEFSIGQCKSQSANALINPNRNSRKIKLYVDNNDKNPCNSTSIWFGDYYQPYYSSMKWYRNGQEITNERHKNSNQFDVKESGRYHAVIDVYGSCKIYSDTVDINIPKAFPMQLTQERNNCIYNLSIPKTDGVVYSWKKDGVVLPKFTSNEFNPTESGKYSVVANLGFCSYESNKVEIDLGNSGRLTEQTRFCVNDTLRLTTTKADSYRWSGPNNFSSNVQNPVIFKIDEVNSGLYSLVKTSNGCVFKDSLAVQVRPKPQFEIDKADTYCLGKTISLIARNKGQENSIYYIWTLPNVPVSDESYFSAGVNIPSKTNSAVYTIIGVDGRSGCSSILTTQITSKENNCNSIELIKPQEKACFNTQVALDFKLEGSLSADETLDLYGLDFRGNKSKLSSVTKSPIVFNYNNYYASFFIESSKQKIRSNFVELQTSGGQYAYISYNTTSVCDGYNVPLKIDSNYYRIDKIQWFFNNKEISNANNYAINADKTGTYSVKAETNGCPVYFPFNSVNVTVGAITPSSMQSVSTNYVCDGYNVKLRGYDYKELKDVKYQWQLDGQDIPNTNSLNFTATKNGIYRLKTTQGKCEAFSNEQKVFIGELFSPRLSSYPFPNSVKGEVEICKGFSVNLKSNYYDDGNSTGSFTSEEGFSFQWQKNGVDIPNATSGTYQTNQEGVYRLKVMQGGCMTLSDNITVKYGKSKLFHLYPATDKSCEGNIIPLYFTFPSGGMDTLSGSFDKLVFQLNKDNLPSRTFKASEVISVKESGAYHLSSTIKHLSSEETCTVYSDTVKVELKGKVVPFQLLPDNKLTTCSDSLYVWAKDRKENIGINYKWKLNSAVLQNENTEYLLVKKAGTYEVEYEGENGCIFQSQPLSVELKKLDIKISKYADFCSNRNNYLYAELNSYYPDTARIQTEWFLDGKSISQNYQINVSKSGTYNLVVKHNGCSATASSKEEVAEIPKFLTPNEEQYICPDGYINLESPKADKYTWFINNQSTTLNTQVLKIQKGGTYGVWLEKGNCKGFTEKVNVVEKIIFPTATISGSKDIQYGDSTKIKIDLTSSAPWTVNLTNNQTFNVDKSPIEFFVKPQQSTSYGLLSVKNTCGEGSVSGKATINILILGNEEIEDVKINLFPIPTQNSCQLFIETLVPKDLHIELFGVDGRKIVDKVKMAGGSVQNELIDLETYPNGTYILKIMIGDRVVSRKIIKQ
ncbi:hypothetical protein GCM10027035_48520 [Emticicia sediminis]